MNEGLQSLKEAWNEKPLEVIHTGAYVLIAFATFISVVGRRRR